MNESESIADLAVRAAGVREPVEVTTPDGRTLLFVPAGLVERDISDPNREIKRPEHIRQSVTVQTVDALVEYLQSFKTAATRMFADIDHSRIVSVIDYHHASDEALPGPADHLFHRATLTLPFSQEWKTWMAVTGKMMSQLEFARFIEENAADIEAPSGAELLEVVRDLHAVRKVNFKKVVRTATDHENFEYSDETEARTTKGNIELPTKFLLRLPIYFGDAPTSLFAFLRWHLDEGALQLGVKLHRAEHVRQAVFKQIVLDVAARTERPAIFGSL